MDAEERKAIEKNVKNLYAKGCFRAAIALEMVLDGIDPEVAQRWKDEPQDYWLSEGATIFVATHFFNPYKNL